MRRDLRLRNVQVLDFAAAEDYELPSTFKALIDLYHDGAGNYGRIMMVSPGELSERKRRHGNLGVPAFVAVIDGDPSANLHTLRFAPEPSGSYTLRMTYEGNLVSLTDTPDDENWLLTEAPDLYMWATLACAEGYLQEDERIALWKKQYEEAADEFKRNADRREYGGPLTPRPSHVIGEDVRNY